MHDIGDLLRIMAALRDRQTGCPWDVAQDFASIAPFTIEEAYEVADAIDRGDFDDLRDELGDLLLQVVFHAQMAKEAAYFDFGDVVAAICNKMVARHPHVFADGHSEQTAISGASSDRLASGNVDAKQGKLIRMSFANAEEQTQAWERIKADERAAKGDADTSALAGISRGMPEWQRALKLQQRAARVGFDWPSVQPVFDKLHEELDEVRAEFATGADADRLNDEIGDVLFVCVNLARHAKVDVSRALRHANAKFERRFRRMEALAANAGETLAGKSLAEQDTLWDRAKAEEKNAAT
jgi:nucleoside triphosphate diphosphatase